DHRLFLVHVFVFRLSRIFELFVAFLELFVRIRHFTFLGFLRVRRGGFLIWIPIRRVRFLRHSHSSGPGYARRAPSFRPDDGRWTMADRRATMREGIKLARPVPGGW